MIHLKMLIEGVVGLGAWSLASLAFFHIWCRRFGKYLSKDSVFIGGDGYTTSLPDGWYVAGWQADSHVWYSLGHAMILSFFFWLPVSLIIALRESIGLIGKGGEKTFTMVLPEEMRVEPLRLARPKTDDAYVLAAYSEVDALAPDYEHE